MNKQLLSFFAFLALSFSAAAQCNPADHVWTSNFGVSPDPTVGENFQAGTIGVPYADVVYVKTPTTAADIDPTLPTFVVIDSIHLDAIFYGIVTDIDTTWADLSGVGLSVTCNNLGDSPDPCMFMSGNAYCGDIAGTPTVTGSYPVKIVVTAYLNFFGPQAVPYEFTGYTLNINPAGVEELNWENFITLAPNPASNYSLISFPVNTNGNVTLDVYNTMGQRVTSEVVTATVGMNSFRVNTEDLSNGQYIVRLQSANGVAEVALQVQH